MVDHEKMIFGTTCKTLIKCQPEKEIFQTMTFSNTHKSPLRKVFFFVYYKLGWNMNGIEIGRLIWPDKVVNKMY